MKTINICIPTLNRYDLLVKMLKTVVEYKAPDNIFIIDNGGNLPEKHLEPIRLHSNVVVEKPGKNLGVAASWNWFCKNIPEYRLICNDDMYFFEDTLEIWLNGYDENFITYPGGVPSANSFSAFMISDKIIEEVGYFDEEISPNYAYFEDNDYHRRMLFKGFDIKAIPDCRIGHHGSSTLQRLNMLEHHIKFRLAQSNYIRKWGGLPQHETFDTPYNL